MMTTYLTCIELFKTLRENKLNINFKKCYFVVKEINFLGFIINEFGIFVDTNKIKAIKDWPQPRMVKKIVKFPWACFFL